MKKTLLITFFALAISFVANSQNKVQDFVTVQAGIGLSNNEGKAFKFEYGVNLFGFYEPTISFTRYSSHPQINSIRGITIPKDRPTNYIIYGKESDYNFSSRAGSAIMLNNSIDIVRLFFPETNHGLKITGSIGYSVYQVQNGAYNNKSVEVLYNVDDRAGFDYGFSATYRYNITDKISANISYEFLTGIEVDMLTIGLSRKF